MSHAIKAGTADPILLFRAYDTDGSPRTDLTSAEAGLSLSIHRVGSTDVAIGSLSDKATPNATHSDGAIYQISGNLYSVDTPDAAVATQVPSVCIQGSYTAGVIEGIPHPITGYDATDSDNLGLAIAVDGTFPVKLAMISMQTVGASETVDFDKLAAIENHTSYISTIQATIAEVKADTGNLVTRIPAALFSGITSLAAWLGVGFGKSADAGTLAEVQATTGGATYNNATDSPEAIRDRGDTSWVTGSGGDATAANQTTILSNQATILSQLGAATVTITSPVASDGTTITVRQGFDYQNDDNLAIVWSGDTADQWPDLTGATVTFKAVQGYTTITKELVITASTGTQSFYAEFTADDLNSVNAPTGSYRYYITAVLSNGNKIPLYEDGTLRIEQPFTSGES